MPGNGKNGRKGQEGIAFFPVAHKQAYISYLYHMAFIEENRLGVKTEDIESHSKVRDHLLKLTFVNLTLMLRALVEPFY